jgi:hypothetical protein
MIHRPAGDHENNLSERGGLVQIGVLDEKRACS